MKQRSIYGSTDKTVRLKRARETTLEIQKSQQKYGRNMGKKLSIRTKVDVSQAV